MVDKLSNSRRANVENTWFLWSGCSVTLQLSGIVNDRSLCPVLHSTLTVDSALGFCLISVFQK